MRFVSILLIVAVCASAPAVCGASELGDIAPDGQTASAADSVAGVPAVWKAQRAEFHYVGRTTRYSCEGLREKVRAMLLDLGVRRDLSIEALGCAAYRAANAVASAGAKGFRLAIAFFAPVPAHRAASSSVAPARFQPFTITSDAFRNMGVGDCELVKEFARQLLPRLTVRDLRQDITCVRDQPSVSQFFVQGEILKTDDGNG
jgi:hypothetical protein